MQNKTFTLRVDLESDRGIKEGLPKLLDLLGKYNMKASFYIPMGGESNLIDFVMYRGKMESAGERSIKVWTLGDKLRMILSPRDFVKKNENMLKRILREGHELGLHGWKHREWTRGLDKINVKERIIKSRRKYKILFGKDVISFCSPGFNTNLVVLKILRANDIRFISDFAGDEIKIYDGMKNVPITICGNKRTPIIEWLVSQGKPDEEIILEIIDKIKTKRLSSIYIHDLFEARFKLDVLEEVFKFVKNNEIEVKRIIDF